MKQGIIVFLNGTSSSGKTSISKELLNQNEISFRHLSIDDFFHGLFHDYIDFINTKCSKSADGEDVEVSVQIIIDSLVTLFYSTVKFMSEKGINVVVDTVNDNEERFNTCLGLLIDRPVLFVGVTCSKEELIRREKLREDRQSGLAIAQYDIVYRLNEYDIELNTETSRSNECANLILNASSLFEMGKIDRDFIWRGGHDKLVSIAKSLCFAAFASTHARRGSMSNRSISLENVTLPTK